MLAVIWTKLTVHILVSSILEAQIYNLVCCCENFRLIDVAIERVPRVPT